MRTTTIHRSPIARTTSLTRYRTPQPRRGPRWWPAEREEALQSTRMLSLVMLSIVAGWALILLAALVWFA